MKKLANITTSFPDWYNEVLKKAELIDDSPTKGTYIIRPYGYSIWEKIQQTLDKKIKDSGAENAYFPLLIPEDFLKKEADHVEGFAPEVAVVTHAGGKKLDKPYVIRPTSETIIYHSFARWIKSWRDLPLKINQWANVVRWEMRTRPFLRVSEFLWQEGHTAHATQEDAQKTALEMLECYRSIAEELLCIPVATGLKPPSETFPGADKTFTFEGLMPDGKALQMGTSHMLSQSFSSAFGVQFQDKNGKQQAPFCTSWGVTVRLIGAVTMVHGDQEGLIMPPPIAPIQVVIIPILKGSADDPAILEQIQNIKKTLIAAGIRTRLDQRSEKSPGAKFFEWEVKGVPLRLEIGPRDFIANQVTMTRRFSADPEERKVAIPIEKLTAQTIQETLNQMAQQLFARAQQRRNEMIFSGDKISSFGKQLSKSNGMFKTGWCGNTDCEKLLKEHQSSIRCLLETKESASCFGCDQQSNTDVFVAKAY